MSNNNLSDIDIEILLLGKWRFNTSSEKITIQFKEDMSYQQTRVQTSILSKFKELILGNKYTGVWYVIDRKLYLNVKTVPTSSFNIKIPLNIVISIADIVATLSSVLGSEIYDVIEINNSKFRLVNKEESIVGIKIN